MIPKIIHYCWLSGDSIPHKLQKCMDSWKKYLPDYKFMLWDLNRFNIDQSIWVKQAFEAKKYAFAADYIRLYAIYNYGGIYMDMDVEVVKSFDDLLCYPCLLGMESKEGIEAGIFGATIYNSYINNCLKHYTNREFILGENLFDLRPLPTIMLEVAKKNYNIINRRGNELLGFYNQNDLYVFQFEYLTAKDFKTGEIKATNNTYSIHHFAGSWLPISSQIKQRIIWLLGDNVSRKLMSFKRWCKIFSKL